MIWKQAGAFELKAGVAQSPSPRGNEDMKKNHKKSRPSERLFLNLAVGQGFEPREPLGSTVFKTAAFDHSASPPDVPALGWTRAHYSGRTAGFKTLTR